MSRFIIGVYFTDYAPFVLLTILIETIGTNLLKVKVFSVVYILH